MSATSALCYEERTLLVPNTSPIVFVVDDDISVRESLEVLIRDAGWQVETFPSAEEFINRSRDFNPGCLILDISMPGLNGLDLQKRLAVQQPEMPIIFMTGHGDIPKSVQAMKAGAVEFLTKPFSEVTLIYAIRGAIERSKVLVERIAELQALKSRYARLTSREREVFALVASGLLNKQVGGELGMAAAKRAAGEETGMQTAAVECVELGDPVGAAAHVKDTLADGGTWMVVEPFGNDRLEDNLNPIGRVFYAASTMVCVPASLSQEVALGLGTQAGEARLRKVLADGGFSRVRRATATPFNLVLEARK